MSLRNTRRTIYGNESKIGEGKSRIGKIGEDEEKVLEENLINCQRIVWHYEDLQKRREKRENGRNKRKEEQ